MGTTDMRIVTAGNLIGLGIQRETAAGETMRGAAARVASTENLVLAEAGAGVEAEAGVAARARVCRSVVWVPTIVQAPSKMGPRRRLLRLAIWPS